MKFITAFTVGHSITLLAATLFRVQANPYLIDAVIAVSVIYKGFDNLDGFRQRIGILPPNLLGMVFAFGLMHGFGLATRLQQWPLPNDGLVVRILAFNAGVELGQIAALAAMFAVLQLWRRSATFAHFSIIANASLIAAGTFLFLSQMHLYQHERWPDEFGFSKLNHELDHLTNDALRNGAERFEPVPTSPETGVTIQRKP